MTQFSTLLFLCIATQDQPHIEDEKRRELEQEPAPMPETQDLLWDWGGWLNVQYLALDDPPFESRREQRFYDLRVWGTASFEKRYRLYVRLRNTFQDYNDGDQFGHKENEWNALRLDQGYLEASWPEFATSFFGRQANLHARAGRQYLVQGSGLLINGVYDGIQLDAQAGAWAARLFGARTIHSEGDIDRSLPDRDNSDRFFAGFDLEYQGFGAHRPYALVLAEFDRNDEDDPLQDYSYDAQYFALGMKGSLFLRGLGYHVEAVYEAGRSSSPGTTSSETIAAWAFLINLEYYAPLPASPLLFASLWWATGDEDRASPTDSLSGNTAGTDDDGFLSFGYLPTGFALSPRLSNIHILRIGATFKPLEKMGELVKTLEIGVAYYLYSKDQEEEPITDPRSFLTDNDIGQEIDLFLRWRVLSDIGVSVNYGRFLPGDAYQEDHGRDFFSMGITYSF